MLLPLTEVLLSLFHSRFDASCGGKCGKGSYCHEYLSRQDRVEVDRGLLSVATAYLADPTFRLLNNVFPLNVTYNLYLAVERSWISAHYQERVADFRFDAVTTHPHDSAEVYVMALAKILPDYKYAPEKNGAFHNFLTGVLRNKALCALDASRRQMAIEERMQLAISVNGKSVHEQSYRDWRENLFEVALQQLLSDESIHDRTKQAFIRTAINGESIEAVAASLGVQRNTVDCMRSRTLRQLREIVERLKDLC